MKNWEFIINRLLIFLGMIGSFMGATFGYSIILLQIMGEKMFLALLGFEFMALCLFVLVFLVAIIDFIKDIKRGRI